MENMINVYKSLEVMGKGMLAIFVVIIVIYMVINILLKFNKVKAD